MGKLGTVGAEYYYEVPRWTPVRLSSVLIDLGRCGQVCMWLINYEINRRKWLNLQSTLMREHLIPLADD
jgi:hypothetical protein